MSIDGDFRVYIIKLINLKIDAFMVLESSVSSWYSLLNLVVQENYSQPKISIRNPDQCAVSELSVWGGPQPVMHWRAQM